MTAQTEVSGTVRDAGGEPLIGVTVRPLRGSGGTVTDVDGTYRLTVAGPETTLRFSYLGYESRREQVGSRTWIDVALAEASNELTEVVVTAYGGESEVRDVVGSYGAVEASRLLADRPVESVTQLLEGQIAGVRVETVTGEPGLPISVSIRGQADIPAVNGISPSSQPLYVLDGVPLYDVAEAGNRGSFFGDFNNTALNPLAFINPDDIESITVLKDASAAALYGSDASNGVVLITTKRGTEGPARITLSANYGWGETINELQFLNTEQYLELARETLLNDGRDPRLAGPPDVSTNWRDLVTQTPVNTDVDLTMSGGAAGITYRLGAGYNRNESLHLRNGLEQGNFNLRLGLPAGEKIDVDTRFSVALQRREGLNSFNGFAFIPNLPVRNADGSFNNDGFFARRPNPLALLEQNENYTDSRNLNGQFTLNYLPLTSVSVRLMGGLDQTVSNQFQYRSGLNGSGALNNGFLILSDTRNLQWTTNGQVTWKPEGTGDHHFSAQLGGEARRQDNYQQVINGRGFPNDEIRRIEVLPRDQIDGGETRFERATLSQFGQLAYDYAYRYYLKLNARRDATSIFGGDRQADVFWSAGASWNFSEEPGLAGRLPFGLQTGKLRATYGVRGNSRLGIYTAGGTYTQAFADENYGGFNPAFTTSPANDLLGWERKFSTNLGLDLGWAGGRFGLTAEWYNDRTVDGLFNFQVPYESGFSSVVGNSLSLRNRGLEFTFSYRSKNTAHWRYRTDLNAARNRNLLLGVDRETLPETSLNRVLIVGLPTNLIYGIPFAGVNPATGMAEYRLPDGTVTSERSEVTDRSNYVPLGQRQPDVTGGWQNSLTVGGLSASVLVNYSFGSDILIDRLYVTDGQQILINNQSVDQLDRWRQPGDVTDVPRLSIDNAPVTADSRYVYPLDFIQLAAISLSYDLTRLEGVFAGLRQCAVVAVVNNVGYWYFGERRPGRNGVAEYRFPFPQQRAYTVGVKVGW